MKRAGIFKLVYELLKYYIYSSCNQQKHHIKLVLLICNEILRTYARLRNDISSWIDLGAITFKICCILDTI